jgi:hypothetical protein
MPIPNVSSLYKRLNDGAEGGHEFARFLKLLLGSHYAGLKEQFKAPSDAAGDFRGLDAFLEGPDFLPEMITGFQFKFYPGRLKAGHKADIRISIENAVLRNPYMREFILVTPEDFMKEQQTWFEQIWKEFAKHYRAEKNGVMTSYTFSLIHWGHTKIIELALRHEPIARHYFPELFPQTEGSLRLSFAGIDCINSNWNSSSQNPFSYFQHFGNEKANLTSDPVFDFQFVNSTNEIILLRAIEIHIEKVGHLVKGIGAEYFLRSIGTMEYTVDFSKPINVIELGDPLILNSNSPFRFSIQLKEFTRRAPGNYAYVKFWFYFDHYTCPTESFYLSF